MRSKKLLLAGAFSCVLITSYSQPCVVSEYPFNGNANDAVGPNNGTVNGAVLATGHDGIANSAYYFDGVSNYIQVSEDFDYPEKTVCLWFNAATITTATGEIFGTDYPGLTHGNIGAAVLDISGTKSIRFFGGGVLANQFDYPINANQWYHLAMVKSATGYKYYLNCVLVKSCGAADNTSSSGTAGTTFGTDRAFTKHFNGTIDNVTITNCALNDQEICNKYNSVAETKGLASFSLFPNPVKAGEQVNIHLGDIKASSIEVVNAMGERIYVSQLNATGSINLDPALFTSGIYFINIKSEGILVKAQKLIVE